MELVIEPKIADAARRSSAIERVRKIGVALPTWSALADPAATADAAPSLDGVDPDSPHAANLWRVHWFNDGARKGRVAVPAHVVLPPDLTGVAAPIVVLLVTGSQ